MYKKIACINIQAIFLLVYFLSSKISLTLPKLDKAFVASKGINILFASPFAISCKASNYFNCTNLSPVN